MVIAFTRDIEDMSKSQLESNAEIGSSYDPQPIKK